MPVRKLLRRYPQGAVIVAEGSPSGGEIYYLAKGTAAVEVQGKALGDIRVGEWFGELAAILGSVRTATIRARTPCEVLVFQGVEDRNLYEAIAKDGEMLRKLIEQLCLRLIETSRKAAAAGPAPAADPSARYRRAISGTLHVLRKLSELHRLPALEELRNHLSTLSGLPEGRASDADPRFFPSCREAVFGS